VRYYLDQCDRRGAGINHVASVERAAVEFDRFADENTDVNKGSRLMMEVREEAIFHPENLRNQTTYRLEQDVLRELENNKRVVIDLAGISEVTTQSLRRLIRLVNNREVEIANMDPRIRQQFDRVCKEMKEQHGN
jgi:hypothetical protein